jgi:hypothetical protein
MQQEVRPVASEIIPSSQIYQASLPFAWTLEEVSEKLLHFQ